MEAQLIDRFSQKDRLLDLLLAHSQGSCSGMYGCQDLKRRVRPCREKPHLCLCAREGAGDTASSKVTLVSPASTAPNDLTSPASKVGASTRLEPGTSLHHLPRCLQEFLLLGLLLTASRVPGLSLCETLAGRGRTGVFSSPHPSIPSPSKHQEK